MNAELALCKEVNWNEAITHHIDRNIPFSSERKEKESISSKQNYFFFRVRHNNDVIAFQESCSGDVSQTSTLSRI
jgi:hypothetical protein